MVSISLETTNRAEAKVRAQPHRDQLDRLFAGMDRSSVKVSDGYSGTLLYLTEQDVSTLCLRYRSNELLEDERYRSTGIIDALREQDIDVYEQYLPSLRSAYANGDLTHVYEKLEAFLRSIQVRVPRGTPPYQRLARGFQVAQIDVLEAVLKRRHGHAVPIPLAPTDTLTFDAVFEFWKNAEERPSKTTHSFEAAFEILKLFSTVSTATMFRRADALRFMTHLKAQDKWMPQTINKQLGFLRAAFQLQVDAEALDKNPFIKVGLKVDKIKLRKRKRLPFSPDELNIWFNGRVYQPGFVARPSLGAAMRWLPLLALHTGGRLEELAQLQREDVLRDETYGWYIKIHTTESGEDDDHEDFDDDDDDDDAVMSTKKKHVKNASSIRVIPIHPKLVELGFIEYVKHIKTGALFPSLRPDQYGILTTSFSTWFGREKQKLGITSFRKVFYSFRHLFSQTCKQKSDVISQEVREVLLGHVTDDKISKDYGGEFYPLERLTPAMHQVEFGELDFSHLMKLGLGREFNAPYVEPVRRPRKSKTA